MRPSGWRPLLLVLALFAPQAFATSARAADEEFSGTKKFLIVLPFNETEILIADVKPHDGKITATVKDALPLRPPPELSVITMKEGSVRFFLKLGDNDFPFVGHADKDGTAYGILTLQGQEVPARLEKTTDKKVTAPPQGAPPLFQSYAKAKNNKDVKSRVQAFQALVAEKPGNPMMAMVYPELLGDAEGAGLSEADVKKFVAEWVNGAKPYGDSYVTDVKVKALTAMAGKASFAKAALELAKEADGSVKPEVSTENRAELAKALATAAKAAGDSDLAKSALAKANKLEAEVDEEYHKKVPPFKPAAESGVKDRKSDRVVLLELFTGAQCPPCVAADVAFDGLLTTYKPTELVTLQYHLHIPGPDPMTNADSVSRQEYYPDFNGTPSTYFDGRADGSGGGPMSASKAKYEAFRKTIDQQLSKPSGAKIDLKVDRTGDSIKISANAEANAEQVARDSAKVGGSKLKLRLAVVEEQIRYVGSNKLRFHHHVVRAMPGGPDGKALSSGKGKVETTLKVDDLRKTQEKYLSDYQKEGGSFASTPPLDLAKLSVVAFVQDDGDKSILNAATAPIDEPKVNP